MRKHYSTFGVMSYILLRTVFNKALHVTVIALVRIDKFSQSWINLYVNGNIEIGNQKQNKNISSTPGFENRKSRVMAHCLFANFNCLHYHSLKAFILTAKIRVC